MNDETSTASETSWPLFEVFIRPRAGLEHKLGWVHTFPARIVGTIRRVTLESERVDTVPLYLCADVELNPGA